MENEGRVVFRRKAYDEMLKWKATLAPKYALLIEGARRVGKTSLIKRFVRTEYESHIYIDFSEKSKLVRDSKKAFTEESDVCGILERLQTLHYVTLQAGRSCLVFDEIQCFPTAREAIKHLVAYGKYHYIESGSLLGIRENVKDICDGMRMRFSGWLTRWLQTWPTIRPIRTLGWK